MSSGASSYIALVKADPAQPQLVPAQTTPAWQVNFLADTLNASVKTKESKHVRPDRMLSNVAVVGKDVGGGYSSNFLFESAPGDVVIEAFLWSTWQNLVAATQGDVDISGATATHATGVLDLSGAAVVPDNISAGVRVQIHGSASNDGIYMLTPVAGQANQYTTTPVLPADETFAGGAVLQGQWIKNSDVGLPLFIERGHVDVDQYFGFTGMFANTMGISISDGDFITEKVDFVGFTADLLQAPRFDNYTPPTTNPDMTTSKHVKEVRIDNVPISICRVKKVDIEIKNNTKGNTGVGVLGNCSVSAHQFNVGGKLTMMFEDEDNYNRLLNGTDFAMGYTITDDIGNTYTIDLPRCKMDTDKINVTGVDADVLDDASYKALADNATASAIIISKFPHN